MRELLGTIATRGWRNYLTWGASTVLIALGFAFVYRFATGSLTGADFVALVGVLAPLMQQLWQRHVEVRSGVANAPSPFAPPSAEPSAGGLASNGTAYA